MKRIMVNVSEDCIRALKNPVNQLTRYAFIDKMIEAIDRGKENFHAYMSDSFTPEKLLIKQALDVWTLDKALCDTADQLTARVIGLKMHLHDKDFWPGISRKVRRQRIRAEREQVRRYYARIRAIECFHKLHGEREGEGTK